MWINRSSYWQRLWSRLTSQLAHRKDWFWSSYLCSRLTKLILIQIELNWIWWHRLFWLNWFTSFLRKRLNSLFSLVCYMRMSWFSSNSRRFFIVDFINRVNQCYWMSGRFSSNSTIICFHWFYWSSDVVLSFDVVDHQVNKFLYTRFVVHRVAWMSNEINIVW